MKHLMLVVVASLIGCGSVQAQTRCDGPKCIYDFDVPYDGWDGWADLTGGTANNVVTEDGHGWIDVHADSGTLYQGNHSHQVWTEAGKGFSLARVNWKPNGDTGAMGWIEHFTDGPGGLANCHSDSHAPIASDEMLLLTLYDDGESFVGGLIGGDMGVLGVVPPPLPGPAKHYAVMALVQKLAGESMPRVLSYVQGQPIEMGGTYDRLQVEVWQAKGKWHVSALGLKKPWPEDGYYRLESKMASEPNLDGMVGIDAVVLAKPYCIYEGGGEIARRFRVDGISAWK